MNKLLLIQPKIKPQILKQQAFYIYENYLKNSTSRKSVFPILIGKKPDTCVSY